MPDDDQSRELKSQLWGWILFVMSAVFFVISSIKNGDVLGFIGSALFLVGCAVFMIPLVAEIRANSGVKGPVQKQGERGEGL